jgi:hypothetical protein
VWVDDQKLLERSVQLAHQHLARAPKDNPGARLTKRVSADLAWLTGRDAETFHNWSFGVLRQYGVTAELAAGYLAWLQAHGIEDFSTTIAEFTAVAETAKSVQFRMARILRGRSVDVSESLSSMAASWEAAMRELHNWHEQTS